MSIAIRVHTNGDDALIAWKPAQWSADWEGFRLERRDIKTGEVSTINNRIPPKVGQGEVPVGGIPSSLSPIRRCLWTDHSVEDADSVTYRVTPMIEAGDGQFAPATQRATAWTKPVVISSQFGDGLSAWFNRGTLMSQVVSRIVGTISVASLKAFKAKLSNPGFPGRRYLSGDARHAILQFLADADRRGNEIYAALYEINDPELIDALKPFGTRGHVLIGNGSATTSRVAGDLAAAQLDVKHRDLSHRGESTPCVHNKFVLERSPTTGNALRVLTGSTNWTTTGLCTQLNNVLVVERPATAERFLGQWKALVAAGDNMTPSLISANTVPANDGSVTTYFAATSHEAEFAPVLQRIAAAKDGLLFLMFTPGQSPLLVALLNRAREAQGPYVRGVVSDVRESANGTVISHDAQVVLSGADPKVFKESALLPDGLPSANLPSWAREEFQRRMYFPAGLNAIIHSKVIVVDPFADDCMVVTGSHNYSDAASKSNDENLVIIRGNKALAQAYAVHIEGVYDHFSWRAFLQAGGNPDSIFKPLTDWMSGGSRERELDFWMR